MDFLYTLLLKYCATAVIECCLWYDVIGRDTNGYAAARGRDGESAWGGQAVNSCSSWVEATSSTVISFTRRSEASFHVRNCAGIVRHAQGTNLLETDRISARLLLRRQNWPYVQFFGVVTVTATSPQSSEKHLVTTVWLHVEKTTFGR